MHRAFGRGANYPDNYNPLLAALGKPQPGEPSVAEDPAPYLKGKSDLFLSRIDCELECDGIVFPIHSAIASNASALLDQMLESYLPGGSEEATAGAEAATAGSAASKPRIVLQKKKEAGQAADGDGSTGTGGAADPVKQAGEPSSRLTPEKLRLFLVHIYDADLQVKQEREAVSLLEMSDFFQAPAVKKACDRALEAIAKACHTNQGPPKRFLELAARHKLRRLMSYCMSATVVWISQGRFAAGGRGCTLGHALPYLELIDSSLKNELIFELAQSQSLGDNSVAQLAEHFAASIDRLGWDN